MNWKRINKSDRKKYREQKEARDKSPFSYSILGAAPIMQDSVNEIFHSSFFRDIKKPFCKRIINLYIAKN